ncbi:MAG: TolC family protein, partial [Bacteroidota bacterium]
ILKKYIEDGLSNNLVMKEKNITLQQSLLALKEARSWFYPTAGFMGDYTWAEGGRTIDLPIGDLLNPVYSTLNQLTASNKFPMISNTSVQLLPQNFYDAKIRVAYPVVNTEIIYNAKIKKEEVHLAEYEIETYREELTHNIETAYYNYCLAVDAAKIYESAMTLVQRNLQVNQSLVKNGKGLTANVLRAESEKEVMSSRIREATNQQKNATSWFNFLLNRSLNDTVIYENQEFPAELTASLTSRPVTEHRSELKELGTAISIRNLELKMNNRYAIPKVNTFIDLGSQASDWQFDSKSRYFMAGLQVTVPIFSGMRNRVKISSTRLAVDDMTLRLENTSRQFTVAAAVAQNNLNTALVNLGSSEKQYQSAKAYFNLVEKGYSEGINSLLEFMDARNQLTGSEIQVRLNRYKVLSAFADLKRQTASSTIQ